MKQCGQARVVTALTTREYFHGAVQGAVRRQKLQVSAETVVYVTHLLTGYARSESLYRDDVAPRSGLPALAQLYGLAATAPSAELRDRALQRLGDLALFVSGLYAGSLSRSLVDVDYYIAMGGGAYASLADSTRCGLPVLQAVYRELADGFVRIMDVLAEVGDADPAGNRDVLRLYEIWRCSGSRYAAERLRGLGIDPVAGPAHAH